MDKNEQKKQQYNDYVEQITPKHNLLKNMLCAFLVGGLICVLGQVILNICGNLGLDKDASGSWCSLLLVLLSVVLTAFNIYPKIAKYAGAGTIVPITGFANSIASPAVEYKTEGLVLGTCVKMFTIAGPVLVCGLSASVVYGLIYYIMS